ncbi:MAG: twin-arginine translocase TatA/TatE family subunit [Candidatus Hydrogenedentota bacterium]
MFGSIGVFEIVLIAGLALMILGPDKFPEFAKISMRTMRDIRKYMSDAQRDIASELNPLKQELDGLKKIDVESYVDDLISDGTDEDMDDDDDGSINLEPDASVIDDWYPEELNEIMPGDDETADRADEATDSDEDSAQEHAGEAVPYESETSESIADDEAVESESVPEREDDFQMTGGYEGREEVVDTSDPERLDG